MIKPRYVLWALPALLALVLPFATTTANEGPARLVGKWDKKNQVELCSSEGGRCYIATLPSEIGTPKRLIEGDFVKTSPLSWVVLTKSSAHLCSVSSDGPTINCAAIIADIPGVQIDIKTEASGPIRWEVRGSVNNKALESKARKLVANFDSAKKRLESTEELPSFSPMLVDAGDTPPPATCDGCDSDGSDLPTSGSGDGGGGGGAPGVIIIVGPKPPPPPVDPHLPLPFPPSSGGSGTGFWCTSFGIGCPAIPTVPEPTLDCRRVKNEICMPRCEPLITGKSWNGDEYYRCLADCQREYGCR